MPRKYIRKVGACPRAEWTQESLIAALDEMSKGVLGINEISRRYGIPSRTLRRRFKNKNTEKKTLGKHPVLDFDNEKRLVMHIQKLEKAGFPPSRDMIRRLAFEFAEKLGIETSFDKETRKAGPYWLRSFLELNSELSIRQAEGLSVARAQGLNRAEVDKMFELLLNVMMEFDLLDKPDRIYNVDETGVQLNNSTGKVIATKGARVVHSITSAEKGETLSVIACCNAVGNFLPPIVIIKGVNKKPEFHDGLPPGAEVYMNRKSAYVNAELFHKWLKEHFVPKKPQGKVILLLDGHSSHTNAIDMLQTAEENEIILFCLPSHSTQALQPLDRSFFKPFKTFYSAETRNWILSHKERKINRLVAGKLIGNAWTRAATTSNAISGFRACGIYPFNPSAIPESFFAISDNCMNNKNSLEEQTVHQNEDTLEQTSGLAPGPSNTPGIRVDTDVSTISSSNKDVADQNEDTVEPEPGPSSNNSVLRVDQSPSLTGPSNKDLFDRRLSSPSILSQNDNTVNIIDESKKETPSKYLEECSPVPKIPVPFYKRGKQSAAILNTKENIETKKLRAKGKATPNLPCKNRRQLAEKDIQKKVPAKRSKKLPRRSSSSHESEISTEQSDESNTKDSECTECFEEYEKTKSTVDWIQCIMCKQWLHENCTMYGDFCNKCGRTKRANDRKLEK